MVISHYRQISKFFRLRLNFSLKIKKTAVKENFLGLLIAPYKKKH